jgi:hypothetical protein
MSEQVRNSAIVLAVLAAVLGATGFYLARGALTAASAVEILIGTIQLFVLNVSADSLVNWPLRAAAVIGPVSTGLAATTALLGAYGTQIRDWRLRKRLRHRPADVLFIGGGHFAATRARYVRRQNPHASVTVIDRSRDCAFSREPELREGNIHVLAGDALREDHLLSIGADRAREVWIGCGSDLVNIEVLRTLTKIARKPSAGAKWYVDLANRELLRMAQKEINDLRGSGIDINAVNVDRDLARELFSRHPPAIPGPAGREHGPLHIAVVGATELAEEILVHAVHHFVLDDAPANAVRISWFGDGAEARLAELRKRYPAIDPQSEGIEALTRVLPVAHIHAHDCDERTLGLGVWMAAQREFDFSIVYVACRGVDRTLITELRWVTLRDADPEERDCLPEIVVAGLYSDTVESRQGKDRPEHVAFFKPTWAPDDQSSDESARLLNASYAIEKGRWNTLSPADRDEAARQLWQELPEDLRWSSRLGADHATLVRAPVFEMARSSGDIVERLARIEHRRFVVERLMGGWLPVRKSPAESPRPSGAHDKKRDREYRLSDQLREFDEAARAGNEPAIREWIARRNH